jgi:hypothetical protein
MIRLTGPTRPEGSRAAPALTRVALELCGGPEVAEHRQTCAPGDGEPAVVADGAAEEQALVWRTAAGSGLIRAFAQAASATGPDQG